MCDAWVASEVNIHAQARRGGENWYHDLQVLWRFVIYSNIWVLSPFKQETQQHHFPDGEGGGGICGYIIDCHCQDPGLGSQHTFPPWKEWVIAAYNENWAVTRCVFTYICVCMCCVCVCGLAAASVAGNGVKSILEKKVWRCYRLGMCTKAPLCKGGCWVRHTHTQIRTHTLSQPAATTSPRGTFHSDAAWHEQSEVILIAWQIRKKWVWKTRWRQRGTKGHEREKEGCSDSSDDLLNVNFFVWNDNVSLFLKEKQKKSKQKTPVWLWNVWVSVITRQFSPF